MKSLNFLSGILINFVPGGNSDTSISIVVITSSTISSGVGAGVASFNNDIDVDYTVSLLLAVSPTNIFVTDDVSIAILTVVTAHFELLICI